MKENKQVQYYKLVDHINGGMIVRTENEDQYMYVYGESIWQETGILLLYYTEDTVFYEKYQEITEEQADGIIEQTKILYHELEKICIHRLRKLKLLIPDVQSKDLEIKIIYLLYYISKKDKIDIHELKDYGFTPRMLRALQVLIDNGNIDNDLQMENILENTLAMLAKNEDILQNGQKSKRDNMIIKKTIEYKELTRRKI